MTHILQKIIVDDANAGFARTWNQQLIRPCQSSYEEIIKAEEDKSYQDSTPAFVLNLGGAVVFQKEDEGASEFLMRAAIEGYGPEFEMRLYRDSQWNEYLIDFVDLLKNKVLYHSTLLEKTKRAQIAAYVKQKTEKKTKG